MTGGNSNPGNESSSIVETQQKSFITRKLNNILDSKIENDKETLEALKVLSTYYSDNNLRTRRVLRGEIEKRSLLVNESFLQTFTGVKEVLDTLCKDIQTMDECCQDLMSKLHSTKSQAHELISKTSMLQNQSYEIDQRSQVIDAFLNHFQLKPEEVQILRGNREGNLDENFFKVLQKVKTIHSDCKFLLHSNQQTAGLEIMESMALYQETAAERLYRWIQNECRVLNSESPEPHPLLGQALNALQERPVLFQYSVDECANARRAASVRSFIDALTRGGPGGLPCPIELHSHDPMRYIGDMMAWVHQCVASEKELLQVLLRHIEKEASEPVILQALCHISEGLCRPFKMRVEQVIVAEHHPVILFKLINLIKFYLNILKNVMVRDCVLVTTMEELVQLAHKLFYASLAFHSSSLSEKVQLPPADLGPTDALKSSLTLLQSLLSSQDTGLVTLDDRKSDIPKVVSSLIDPMLQVCYSSATKLVSLDMATYLANCSYLVHSTLSLFQFTEVFLEKLQAQMEAHLDTLVSEQGSQIITQLGLGTFYNTLQQYQPKQGPLSTLPGCDQFALNAATKKIDGFLASPDSFLLQQNSLLLSVGLRQRLRHRSMELVVSVYKQIYEAVSNPNFGYPDVTSLLPRTPDQMRELIL